MYKSKHWLNDNDFIEYSISEVYKYGDIWYEYYISPFEKFILHPSMDKSVEKKCFDEIVELRKQCSLNPPPDNVILFPNIKVN